MIKLIRKTQAHEARVHLKEKSARFLALKNAGQPVPVSLLKAYKDEIVKKALIEEACKKCGYCESKVLHAQFGDVEHLKPKDIQPDLRLDYDNLVLSCVRCNNAKNVNYDEQSHHVDPYRDEPSTYLMAFGHLVWARPADAGLGGVTEFVFDLNRTDLLEARLSRLGAIKALASEYAAATGLAKILARKVLQKEAGQCGEYSMFVLSYLRLTFPLDGF